MTSFTFYDRSSVSYDACLRYTTVFFDCFRYDPLFIAIYPDIMGRNPLLPEPERTAYEKALCRAMARSVKLGIMSGYGDLVLANQGTRSVAACACAVPVYKSVPVSFFQWIKIKIYGLYVQIANRIDGIKSEILHNPELGQFFQSAKRMLGAAQGPEYYTKLANLGHKDLIETNYPSRDTLYINILGVVQDSQGKGYGSQLLKHLFEHYKDLEGPTFKDEQGNESKGPAKASLFCSEANNAFYSRYGFKVLASGSTPLMGKPIENFFMQRLVNIEY